MDKDARRGSAMVRCFTMGAGPPAGTPCGPSLATGYLAIWKEGWCRWQGMWWL